MNQFRWVNIAVFLLAIYVLDVTILSVGFLASFSFVIENSLLLTIVLAAFSTPLYAFYTNAQPKPVAMAVLSALGIYVLGYIIVGMVYDISYDGQTYHLQTLMDIRKGWNPAHDMLAFSGPETSNNIYIQHYAKGYEYAAYSIYVLTGNAEAGKLFNIVMMASVMLVLLQLADIYASRLRLKYKWLMIALVVFNPITFYHFFTYYVDGQLSCCILLLLSGLLLYKHNSRIAAILLTLTTIILISLKFTGIVYAGLIWAFGFAVFFFTPLRKQLLQYCSSGLISVLIAIIIAGYNPYVRNTLENGHPFHPLMGEHKVQIMTGVNAPESFQHKNIFIKVFEANFARSKNVHGQLYAPEPEIKLPFSFNVKEWIVFKSHDVRIGGFGPLWSGILMLFLVGGAIVLIRKHPQHPLGKWFVVIIGFLCVSIFIHPEGWYTRYVPQFWLMPIIAAFLLFQLRDKKLDLLAQFILIIMSVNLAGVAAVSMSSDIILSQEIKSQMKWLHKIDQPVYATFNLFDANRFRMEDAGIDYTEIANPADTVAFAATHKSMTIQNSNTVVYYPASAPAYQPSALFGRLSKYMNAQNHGK